MLESAFMPLLRSSIYIMSFFYTHAAPAELWKSRDSRSRIRGAPASGTARKAEIATKVQLFYQTENTFTLSPGERAGVRVSVNLKKISRVKKSNCWLWIVLLPLFLSGCGHSSDVPATPALSPGAQIPQYTYEIVHTYPHDRGAFTQGLLYLDGVLYESTGLNSESSLRKVELETGKVLKQISVPAQFFAEGLALKDGKLFQLTWQSHKCFVYDLATFEQKKEFSYPTEGWGLTTDGSQLVMSDGSAQLYFLDPNTFEVKRTINVHTSAQLVPQLNELEFIKGEIFANVWTTPFIVRIEPATGQVVGVIDLTNLLPPEDRAGTDVMNGIAWDPKGERLFVTGKHWPKLFEIRLKRKP
jgi:glutamine cyclotransferase